MFASEKNRETMAVGGAAKVDEFVPFPVKDQHPGVDFCVSSSPPWRNYSFSQFVCVLSMNAFGEFCCLCVSSSSSSLSSLFCFLLLVTRSLASHDENSKHLFLLLCFASSY